jgi:hypothetical protein
VNPDPIVKNLRSNDILGVHHVSSADRILADPQAHIDALVEAGVLRNYGKRLSQTVYGVVAPHQHKWMNRFGIQAQNYGDGGQLPVVCKCGENGTARITFEVEES